MIDVAKGLLMLKYLLRMCYGPGPIVFEGLKPGKNKLWVLRQTPDREQPYSTSA